MIKVNVEFLHEKLVFKGTLSYFPNVVFFAKNAEQFLIEYKKALKSIEKVPKATGLIKKKSKIIAINKETGISQVFENRLDLIQALKLNETSVSHCLNKTQSTAGGYFLKYLE